MCGIACFEKCILILRFTDDFAAHLVFRLLNFKICMMVLKMGVLPLIVIVSDLVACHQTKPDKTDFMDLTVAVTHC